MVGHTTLLTLYDLRWLVRAWADGAQWCLSSPMEGTSQLLFTDKRRNWGEGTEAYGRAPKGW